MDPIPVDTEIKWPFKMFVGGISGSGKTIFSINFIKKISKFCQVQPTHIILIFNQFQEIYNELKLIKNIKTQFIHNIPKNLDDIIVSLDQTDKPIVIVDDQYLSNNLEIIASFYLIKARHLSPPSSFIFLSQSLFGSGVKGKTLSQISSNSTHIVLFRNSRLREPFILFEQFLQKNSRILKDVFEKITEKNFEYLFIDCASYSDFKYRYKSDIFSRYIKVFIMDNEKFGIMYLISPEQKKILQNYDKNNLPIMNENDNTLKFSLENTNSTICEDGMNVQIKPIKKSFRKSNNNKNNNNNNNNTSNNNNNIVDVDEFNNSNISNIPLPPMDIDNENFSDNMSMNDTNNDKNSTNEQSTNTLNPILKDGTMNTNSPSMKDGTTNTNLPQMKNVATNPPDFSFEQLQNDKDVVSMGNNKKTISTDNSSTSVINQTSPENVEMNVYNNNESPTDIVNQIKLKKNKGNFKALRTKDNEKFFGWTNSKNDVKNLRKKGLIINSKKSLGNKKSLTDNRNKYIEDTTNENKSLIKSKKIPIKRNNDMEHENPIKRKREKHEIEYTINQLNKRKHATEIEDNVIPLPKKTKHDFTVSNEIKNKIPYINPEILSKLPKVILKQYVDRMKDKKLNRQYRFLISDNKNPSQYKKSKKSKKIKNISKKINSKQRNSFNSYKSALKKYKHK